MFDVCRMLRCTVAMPNLQKVPSQLRLNDIRGEAEEFDMCYDSDVEGEDPYCMAEDLGEDPEGLKKLTMISHDKW